MGQPTIQSGHALCILKEFKRPRYQRRLRDDYKDLSLLPSEQFDSSFFDIQPALDAASRQVSASPTTTSPVKSTSATVLKYLCASGATGATGATGTSTASA